MRILYHFPRFYRQRNRSETICQKTSPRCPNLMYGRDGLDPKTERRRGESYEQEHQETRSHDPRRSHPLRNGNDNPTRKCAGKTRMRFGGKVAQQRRSRSPEPATWRRTSPCADSPSRSCAEGTRRPSWWQSRRGLDRARSRRHRRGRRRHHRCLPVTTSKSERKVQHEQEDHRRTRRSVRSRRDSSRFAAQGVKSGSRRMGWRTPPRTPPLGSAATSAATKTYAATSAAEMAVSVNGVLRGRLLELGRPRRKGLAPLVRGPA